MTAPRDEPPLTPDDFDALDAALDAMREHDPDVPEWEFCDGFLAALVCSRRDIPAEEYWPVLLGDAFRPMEHMEFVWRWRRRWVEVQAALDAAVETLDDERAYRPELLDLRGALLATPEPERGEADPGECLAYGQLWALGFMSAVQAWPQEWGPPRDKDAALWLADALDCIAAVTGDDRAAPTLSMFAEDGPPSVSEERLHAVDEAIWAVYDLRRLWKSFGPRTDTLRKPAEPGRNDPCPCGSGKKYKKCHGAT